MSDIDDKTKARVLREERALNEPYGFEAVKRYLDVRLRELDPPEPKIEPGTLCEATKMSDGKTFSGYYHGGRLTEYPNGGTYLYAATKLTNIRPVHSEPVECCDWIWDEAGKWWEPQCGVTNRPRYVNQPQCPFCSKNIRLLPRERSTP